LVMIKTIIADDEAHAIDRLKDLLAEYDQFDIIDQANDGTSALEKIITLKPDVVFLDINMPGVSVFNTISSLQDPPLVVFQTAHSKYAAEAFDVNAIDFLLKPISRERFSQAVIKIQTALASPKKESEKEPQDLEESVGKETLEKETLEKITIKDRGSIKIIEISDISKISFEDGLTFIYSRNGRFLSDQTLNYYEDKLNSVGFFRSNRANLVNLDYMASLHKLFKGSHVIELKDGSRIELSRRKAQLLKKMFKL
jgi:two-component system LytT family response regulator